MSALDTLDTLDRLFVIAGKPWFVWLAGFLYLVWAAFGYAAEYIFHIERRTLHRALRGRDRAQRHISRTSWSSSACPSVQP